MGFFGGLLNGLGLGSIAGGLSDTAGALIAFFGTITDFQMWRSLGWLLLGIIMIAAGLILFAKDTVASTVVGTAGKALRGSNG